MPKTRERLVSGVLIAGALASLLPQVALAFYAFPSADDYCAAVPPREGFWQAQAFWYVSFTGRYSEMFLESLVTRWELSRMYPWFVLATFVGTGLAIRSLISALVSAVARDRAPSRARVNVVTLVALALLAGGLPSTVEAFYWMSGAVAYQWALVVFGFWVALLLMLVTRPLAAPVRTRYRVLVACLTVPVPGFNEVIAPLIFAALLGVIVYNRRRRLESNRFLFGLAAVVVALTLVSFLAPGNFARSEVYGDDPTRYNATYAVLETGRQMVRFVAKFGAYPALWLGAIGGWWWMRSRGGRLAAVPARYLAAGVAALMGLVYLSLFPLYWVYGSNNYTGEGRTYNVTYVAFFIAVMVLVKLVLNAWGRRSPDCLERLSRHRTSVDLALASALAILLVSAPSARLAARALVDAPKYLELQQQREAVLRAGPANLTAVVEPIEIRPAGLFWGDIQPDEEHWINRCVADYYGRSAIRAGKPPSHSTPQSSRSSSD